MNSRPARAMPEWLSKLVLPIAVSVVGSVLVTALTPLGENLRELLFPTKADVSGLVTVDGQSAPGARLPLDRDPVATADDEGTFLVRDVDDGKHTLEIKAVSSRWKRQPFTIERGASEEVLGEIRLRPLAQLGYSQSVGASFEGLTYDVTLWVIADRDVLDRIESVEYTLPGPFSPTPITRRNTPQQRFCLRRRDTFRGETGIRLPFAAVNLGGGRSFPIAVQAFGPPPPGCPVTGGEGANGSPPPASVPPPPPMPPPPPPPPPGSGPVTVPPVTGQSYENASAQLRARGFDVRRQGVDSDQPTGIVLSQRPRGGASVAPGSTVTLGVSKGPTSVEVPDVTDLDEAAASARLEDAGFEVKVDTKETADPNEDGIVLTQDPEGGAERPAGAEITIVVGRLRP